MAHNLAVIGGQAAMVYLRETPWHGLGRKVSEADSRDLSKVLQLAAMNYEIETEPVQLADGTIIEGSKATIRVDPDGTRTPLAVVGSNYQPTSNARNVEVLDPMISQFGAQVAAAGALGNGSRCWALVKLKDATVTPVPGDDVRGYFLMHWSHDGQVAITGLGTGVRVVCQNTVNLALSAAGGKAWFSVRHTSSAAARLDEAARLMTRMLAAMETTGDTFRALAQKRMNSADIARYIETVFPAEAGKVAPVLQARRDTVARLVFAGTGSDLANQLVNVQAGEASAWAAYNAVTEYFDHVRPAEAKSDSGLLRAQTSAIFGGNAEIKAAALTAARELVAA